MWQNTDGSTCCKCSGVWTQNAPASSGVPIYDDARGCPADRHQRCFVDIDRQVDVPCGRTDNKIIFEAGLGHYAAWESFGISRVDGSELSKVDVAGQTWEPWGACDITKGVLRRKMVTKCDGTKTEERGCDCIYGEWGRGRMLPQRIPRTLEVAPKLSSRHPH